jgi:hypothetical protein
MRTLETGGPSIESVKSSIVRSLMRHAPCSNHCADRRAKQLCASSEWQDQFVVGAITLAKMRQHDRLPVKWKHDNDSQEKHRSWSRMQLAYFTR